MVVLEIGNLHKLTSRSQMSRRRIKYCDAELVSAWFLYRHIKDVVESFRLNPLERLTAHAHRKRATMLINNLAVVTKQNTAKNQVRGLPPVCRRFKGQSARVYVQQRSQERSCRRQVGEYWRKLEVDVSG